MTQEKGATTHQGGPEADPFLTALKGIQPHQHLDLGLLALSSMRQ